MNKKRMAFVSTLGLYMSTIACDPPSDAEMINNPPEQKSSPDTAEDLVMPEKTFNPPRQKSPPETKKEDSTKIPRTVPERDIFDLYHRLFFRRRCSECSTERWYHTKISPDQRAPRDTRGIT